MAALNLQKENETSILEGDKTLLQSQVLEQMKMITELKKDKDDDAAVFRQESASLQSQVVKLTDEISML